MYGAIAQMYVPVWQEHLSSSHRAPNDSEIHSSHVQVPPATGVHLG